uniref:Protein kinase domain-containing protein n=1 Tax=Haplochromis burtoni TaxID=8153 RepID=A0A3Q3C3U1_HAPBU
MFRLAISPRAKHYICMKSAFLGEGGFGIVAKCRDTTTNRAVAIKVNKRSESFLYDNGVKNHFFVFVCHT